MPSAQRYPDNWNEIALSIKEQAQWRCRKCNMQCIRPGEDTSGSGGDKRPKRLMCKGFEALSPAAKSLAY